MATLFSNVSEVYNQYWMDKDLVYNATLKRRFGCGIFTRVIGYLMPTRNLGLNTCYWTMV
jgi:hypothetical protein